MFDETENRKEKKVKAREKFRKGRPRSSAHLSTTNYSEDSEDDVTVPVTRRRPPDGGSFTAPQEEADDVPSQSDS